MRLALVLPFVFVLRESVCIYIIAPPSTLNSSWMDTMPIKRHKLDLFSQHLSSPIQSLPAALDSRVGPNCGNKICSRSVGLSLLRDLPVGLALRALCLSFPLPTAARSLPDCVAFSRLAPLLRPFGVHFQILQLAGDPLKRLPSLEASRGRPRFSALGSALKGTEAPRWARGR